MDLEQGWRCIFVSWETWVWSFSSDHQVCQKYLKQTAVISFTLTAILGERKLRMDHGFATSWGQVNLKVVKRNVFHYLFRNYTWRKQCLSTFSCMWSFLAETFLPCVLFLELESWQGSCIPLSCPVMSQLQWEVQLGTETGSWQTQECPQNSPGAQEAKLNFLPW